MGKKTGLLKLTGDFMELFVAANDFKKNDGRGAGIRWNQELFFGKPQRVVAYFTQVVFSQMPQQTFSHEH